MIIFHSGTERPSSLKMLKRGLGPRPDLMMSYEQTGRGHSPLGTKFWRRFVRWRRRQKL